MYIKSLEAKHIGGTEFCHISVGDGFVYVHTLTSDDSALLLRTGMLFVVESGMERAMKQSEILKYRIAKTVAMISNASVDPLSPEVVLSKKHYSSDRKLLPDFVVLN
jgi:hypothetical protein